MENFTAQLRHASTGRGGVNCLDPSGVMMNINWMTLHKKASRWPVAAISALAVPAWAVTPPTLPSYAPPQGSSCSALANTAFQATGAGSTAGVVLTVNIESASAMWADSSGGGVGAHCKLSGTVTTAGVTNSTPSNIGFVMRLPTDWNGRFVFQGGGGADGFVGNAMGSLGGNLEVTALSRRYAVVSMDSGHKGIETIFTDNLFGTYTGFGLIPTQRQDYAYKAVGTMTDAAKAILNRYYSRQPVKSYLVGCSNGGRQGFMAATRFADKFDGVLAGAPAINIAKQLTFAAWDAGLLNTLAAKPWDAISRSDMSLVGSKIRSTCDALDGATDGIVSDTAACQTRLTATGFPNNLVCAAGTTANCMSLAKVNVLKAIVGGARDGNVPLYANWPWDPGMETAGPFTSWRTWRMAYDLSFGYPLSVIIGGGFLAQVANNNPDMNFNGSATGSWDYLRSYDISQVDDRMDKAITGSSFGVPTEQLHVPSPENLTAFRNKNGRIIVYVGSADPAVSSADTINWYNKLRAFDSRHAEYSRLYVVPGMNHCGGGPTTDVFDLFAPLEKWVETNTAPSDAQDTTTTDLNKKKRVVATLRSNNSDVPSSWLWSSDRSRPLCEYPKVARHNGRLNGLGLPDYVKESSFDCKP
jgi:pimeloyl-ACP methyl ester carboxylesterase